MPRPHLILQDEFPYHVRARTNNQDWFSLPLNMVWSILTHEIMSTTQRYDFMTHAFVLMANHFHWILTTPGRNLDSGMRYFMTESSRKIARACGRINKIFGARYKPTLIDSPVYYANAYRYVLQNPIRAGICKSVEMYPWSTFNRQDVPLTSLVGFHELIPDENAELLKWLNTVPDPKFAGLVKGALRRPTFKFSRHPTTMRNVTGFEFVK